MDATNGNGKPPSVMDQCAALRHSVQDGVRVDVNRCGLTSACTTPEQLRCGINVCRCESHALVELLIRKGVITSSEYDLGVRDSLRREVKSYEKKLSDATGQEVKLP